MKSIKNKKYKKSIIQDINWLMLIIILCFFSCKSQDSIYEEFLVLNGLTYPGPAENVVARPGYERVEISWARGSDPKLVKARIFWNNYTDSVEVAIGAGINLISRIIEPLEENTYSFMVHTYDAEGNVSIPAEALCTVYGELYENALTNRRLKNTSVSNQILTIEWHNALDNEVGINLMYGQNDTIVVDRTETVVEIPNFDIDKTLFYNTMFKPDSLAIDTFYAPTVRIIINQ